MSSDPNCTVYIDRLAAAIINFGSTLEPYDFKMLLIELCLEENQSGLPWKLVLMSAAIWSQGNRQLQRPGALT